MCEFPLCSHPFHRRLWFVSSANYLTRARDERETVNFISPCPPARYSTVRRLDRGCGSAWPGWLRAGREEERDGGRDGWIEDGVGTAKLHPRATAHFVLKWGNHEIGES